MWDCFGKDRLATTSAFRGNKKAEICISTFFIYLGFANSFTELLLLLVRELEQRKALRLRPLFAAFHS